VAHRGGKIVLSAPNRYQNSDGNAGSVTSLKLAGGFR